MVRALAFAESGKAPAVPGPLLRAPVGTTVRLTLRNRSDSALFMSAASGPRCPASATRCTWRRRDARDHVPLDRVGNFFYWAALKGLSTFDDRFWLDSQLTGALIVDAAGAPPPSPQRARLADHRVVPRATEDATFESALVFNGKAWPYNERLTFTQGDSVHFRVINAAAVEHPLHLHGFYFRVTRHGGARADTVVPAARQPLQNMRIIPIGGSLSLSFVPTTPGNWVFHCHFAGHVGEIVSLHGSPDAHVVPSAMRSRDAGARRARRTHDARAGDRHARHAGAGLQGADRSRSAGTINLLIQKRPNGLVRRPDRVRIPAADRRRGAGARLGPDSRTGARAQARRAGAHPGEEQPR